jgi:hypothetical protein
VERLIALYATDGERLELLGITQAADLTALAAQRLLAEHPARSPDRDLDELIRSRRRALARVAMGGDRE